jgi:hypothetical protein
MTMKVHPAKDNVEQTLSMVVKASSWETDRSSGVILGAALNFIRNGDKYYCE